MIQAELFTEPVTVPRAPRRKPTTGRRMYAFNDHHVPYMARHAITVAPELDGFFELRDTGDNRQGDFDEFMRTEFGQRVAADFLKLAKACLKVGQKMGARAIWERIRWHWAVKKGAK